MSRDVRPILWVVAVVAIGALVAMALRPGSTEIVIHSPVDLPPPWATGPDGAPPAVIVSVGEFEETSFFGLVRGDSRHIVTVQFYAPGDCLAIVEQGDAWPLPDGRCVAEVAVAGLVSGTGIASTGEAILAVDVETTEQCFRSLSPGDRWPAASEECAP